MRKRKRPQIAVLFGDMHVGSTVGLMPERYTTLNGNEVSPNVLQRWLLDCWRIAWQEWFPSVVGDDPFVAISTGDMVEGMHHRTTEVWSPDPVDHADAAEVLLSPIRERAEKMYVVRGTECHTGTASEIKMGARLAAERNPETGLHAFDKLHIDIHGCWCVIRHHITTTSRPWLEASGLGLQLANEQLEAAKAKHRIPQVVVCAHRHRAGDYSDGTGMAIVTAPWQGLTRYGHKVVGAAVTKPGICALDWRGKREGELPEYRRVQFELPQPQGVCA